MSRKKAVSFESISHHDIEQKERAGSVGIGKRKNKTWRQGEGSGLKVHDPAWSYYSREKNHKKKKSSDDKTWRITSAGELNKEEAKVSER